jgi:hypothetical protein
LRIIASAGGFYSKVLFKGFIPLFSMLLPHISRFSGRVEIRGFFLRKSLSAQSARFHKKKGKLHIFIF